MEKELERLVKEHTDRYQRHPSGGYRSAPGETAAEALGLLYRVRSSGELSAVFIQNLMFLEDYWVKPLVVDDFHRHLLQERITAQPGVCLQYLSDKEAKRDKRVKMETKGPISDILKKTQSRKKDPFNAF